MSTESILKALEDGTLDAANNILKHFKVSQVLKVISQQTNRNWNGSIPALNLLFEVSRGTDDDEMVERHFTIYQYSLKLLSEGNLNSQAVPPLIGTVLLETDFLPTKKLIIVISLFMKAFENGQNLENKWIEVFPKVLSTIANRDQIETIDDIMTGSEYKKQIFNQLIMLEWKKRGIANLVSIFRDIPMTDEELQSLIKKCLESFREMHVSDVPPFVYQLLRLSIKGHQLMILEGIIEFFNEKDRKMRPHSSQADLEVLNAEENLELLLETEGTVILHISNAVETQLNLGRELLKILKSVRHRAVPILSPFCLAVALCAGKRHRLHDQIMSTLKNNVLYYFQEKDKMSNSFWIRELYKDEENIKNLLLKTIENSKSGWEYITEGMIELGFYLLDSCKNHIRIDFESESPAAEKTAALGHSCLVETFKAHGYAREFILKNVFKKMMPTFTSTPLAGKNYIDILSVLIHASPQTAILSIQKINNCLDYLQDFESTSAISLLLAIMPLLKNSLVLKDGVMIALRKVMFNPDIESRKIAVSGYLLILKKFKVFGNMPMSQSSESSAASFTQLLVDINMPRCNKGANEALCLELLNILSRSLTQQNEIRAVVYKELPEILLKNPQITIEILELFHSQFEKYYVQIMTLSPPINLGLCVEVRMDEPYLLEPIGELLYAIGNCVLLANSNSDEELVDSKILKTWNSCLNDLVKRIIAAEMEDFELDKSSNFGSDSIGIKNRILAHQLMSVYEALIEYSFRKGNMSAKSCEEILGLFLNRQKLAEILKGAVGTKKKPDGVKTNKTVSSHRSLLKLKTVVDLLFRMFSDASIDQVEGRKLLRENEMFVRYLLQVVSDKIQELTNVTKEDDHSQDTCTYLATVARLLLKVYSYEYEPLDGNEQSNLEKLPTLSLITMNLLAEIMIYYRKNAPQLVLHFIQTFRHQNSSSLPTVTQQTYSSLVLPIAKKFQKLVIAKLSEENNDDKLCMKELHPVLTFLQYLTSFRQTSADDAVIENMFVWITGLCKQQNIDDVTLSRKIVSICINLCHQVKDGDEFLISLALAFRITLGDFDKEATRIEDVNPFGVVNIKTVSTLVVLVVHDLEQILLEIDRAIEKLVPDMSQNTLEKAICKRITNLINVCFHFLQTDLPQSNNYEILFVFVKKLYKTLLGLSKHYYNVVQKSGQLCGNFEQLVKHSATMLTPRVYTLISHVQENHKEQNVKKDATAQNAKILKEAKPIPEVIYGIEQYECRLIQLAKKSKVDLMSHFKMSTSRDFRITSENVEENIAGSSGDEYDDNRSNASGSVAGNVASSNKRPSSVASGSVAGSERATNEIPSPVKRDSQGSQTAKRGRLARKPKRT